MKTDIELKAEAFDRFTELSEIVSPCTPNATWLLSSITTLNGLYAAIKANELKDQK